MAEIDVFKVPPDWAFYQADLSFHGGGVTVAGEPRGHGSPIMTLDVQTKLGQSSLYMTPDEALEIWTALGMAIANSTGSQPAPVELEPIDQ